MEKVKLTKEQVEYLDKSLEHLSRITILEGHMTGRWKKFNDISNDDMAKALYIGYEMERTPEEQVQAFYKLYVKIDDYENGVRKGIRATLDYLNIKIEGINS